MVRRRYDNWFDDRSELRNSYRVCTTVDIVATTVECEQPANVLMHTSQSGLLEIDVGVASRVVAIYMFYCLLPGMIF